MGGSMALDLKAKKIADKIYGFDANQEHQKVALKLGLVDEIIEFDGLGKLDLVIVAIPVDAMISFLPKLLDQLVDTIPGQILDQTSGPCVVIDMGSTKENICEVLRSHPRRKQFVAAHPMAGTEHSGPLAAVPDLFARKTAVICEQELSDPRATGLVTQIFHRLQMRIIHMSAKDHDLHVAYVSHLSHISSFVLAATVLEKEKNHSTIFDLAGGGFESTVRLAKSSPAMWGPIFAQNKKNVLASVDAYMDQLQIFRKALSEGSWQDVHDYINDTNRIRGILDIIKVAGHKS